MMTQNITESIRPDSRLFETQKMETVGKLAGGLAHEYNNIMTTIIGQSELLLSELPMGSNLRQHASEIRKAAGLAAALTQQLLAYGGKQILQPTILDINSMLVRMETRLRNLMGRDVDVMVAAGEGVKPVNVDEGQIEQVIINMAMHASKVMTNGGKLTLETANVTLDHTHVSRFADMKAGEYVMLAITNTGTGMSEEEKARAFEPFFKNMGIGEGVGLGLAACYGIIKQSGGHISVYSEFGTGTTFKCYLPQIEPQAKSGHQLKSASELPGGTETVLLVDDDPMLCEIAMTLLEHLGYRVLEAGNGIEAMRLIEQRGRPRIDLLFTDVVMPYMSGKELSVRILASYPNIKTLFTSAHTRNAILHQGLLDASVAFLEKPFTPSALALKMRAVLDKTNVVKTVVLEKE